MSLTSREFWLNYWESKKNLVFPVPQNLILSDFLREICNKRNIKNSLELGGFPGHYSVYLQKYLDVDATLLDYVIHPKIFTELLAANQLNEKGVHIIEADLFNIKNKEKYDLVFSNGLIEHFENTQEIVNIHASFLKEKGTLFISIPNFKGLNGWMQKKFDKDNFEKHYIACMDLDVLKKATEEAGLKNVKTFYNGKFMIWLENLSTKSTCFKFLFKTVWFIFKAIFTIIPIETKWFSPYIVIIANK
ncbi:class I SAM-dependent methyltransferase [uncultured Arcticibacterium sp.]|uniref:class I SAM-dependent methyltransferase n=1 Tax=uncultured Arcticibacterium sp. TaxID=2173042 RepID=UPI0030F95C47